MPLSLQAALLSIQAEQLPPASGLWSELGTSVAVVLVLLPQAASRASSSPLTELDHLQRASDHEVRHHPRILLQNADICCRRLKLELRAVLHVRTLVCLNY